MLTKSDAHLLAAAVAAMQGRRVLVVVPNSRVLRDQAHRFHEVMELTGGDRVRNFTYSGLAHCAHFPASGGHICFRSPIDSNFFHLRGLRFDFVLDENQLLTYTDQLALDARATY